MINHARKFPTERDMTDNWFIVKVRDFVHGTELVEFWIKTIDKLVCRDPENRLREVKILGFMGDSRSESVDSYRSEC